MSLSLGIVGLPNVGKSTLFNALTRSKLANVQNYPFCTIEPNVGVVEVPDERLSQLAVVSRSKKIVPATIKFVDIAGLVKGAAEGAGLGNQFLAHIREVDAIAQVVRAFSDPNIIHVNNKVDPADDVSVVNLELILADLESVTKRYKKTKKDAKGVAPKEVQAEIAALEKVKAALEAGKRAITVDYTDDDLVIIRDLHLLTMKPMMYIVNIDESPNFERSDATVGVHTTTSDRTLNFNDDCPVVEVSAKLEAELADLTPEEAKEYMKELGLEQSGLDQIITAGYRLLDLITYLTSGEPETRAWTVAAGTKAPDAAGVIHTDFVKGFIKADVVNWQDFVAGGGWSRVKEVGKCRLEGKEYMVKDGDVVYFHVNA